MKGFSIAVGDAVLRPGCLRMDWHEEADVPFRPGEELPFEDRAVAFIDCGNFIGEVDAATRLHFLLECRRSLQPGGRIDIAVRAGADSDAARDLLRDAGRAGLVARTGPATASTLHLTKPDRQLAIGPLVSILIPAYNARFFAAALDSALAQTYDRIEIVVCDDSPGSEIEAIVHARKNRFPLRYERNATRLGPRGNFTRCFERAEGEFVKFLCDDDLLAPPCVESLLDAFRRAPDITLATSRRRRIDAAGESLGDQPATTPILVEDSIVAGQTLANAMIMAGLNTIGEPSTTLFRRTDLLALAPDYFRFGSEAGHGIIDMVSWAALLLKGDAVYFKECLSSFRIHKEQRQHDPAKAQRNIGSIRGLQAAWLALKLHERLPPDVLWVKQFPPSNEAAWSVQPVLGFAARPAGSKFGLA
ncbi:MAG TPA: glycosyltransferase [Casimicrobiaceae bacterium]|nr:glycosyltransferase [Casimicrobiaceae bacterium]